MAQRLTRAEYRSNGWFRGGPDDDSGDLRGTYIDPAALHSPFGTITDAFRWRGVHGGRHIEEQAKSAVESEVGL